MGLEDEKLLVRVDVGGNETAGMLVLGGGGVDDMLCQLCDLGVRWCEGREFYSLVGGMDYLSSG